MFPEPVGVYFHFPQICKIATKKFPWTDNQNTVVIAIDNPITVFQNFPWHLHICKLLVTLILESWGYIYLDSGPTNDINTIWLQMKPTGKLCSYIF